MDLTKFDLKRWSVIHIVSGKEDIVIKYLREHKKTHFLNLLTPQRRLKIYKKQTAAEEFKPLYPGYIFYYNEPEMEAEVYINLKQFKNRIPGFIRVLNIGHRPLLCEEGEMKTLFKLTGGEGETIDYTQVYFEGTWAKVLSGPLKGLEGIIKDVDKRKQRLKVELKFLGSFRLVDLSFFEVEKI